MNDGKCDPDGSGVVGIQEITQLLIGLGLVEENDGDSLSALLAGCDLDADGFITFEDMKNSFSAMLQNSGAITSADDQPSGNQHNNSEARYEQEQSTRELELHEQIGLGEGDNVAPVVGAVKTANDDQRTTANISSSVDESISKTPLISAAYSPENELPLMAQSRRVSSLFQTPANVEYFNSLQTPAISVLQSARVSLPLESSPVGVATPNTGELVYDSEVEGSFLLTPSSTRPTTPGIFQTPAPAGWGGNRTQALSNFSINSDDIDFPRAVATKASSDVEIRDSMIPSNEPESTTAAHVPVTATTPPSFRRHTISPYTITFSSLGDDIASRSAQEDPELQARIAQRVVALGLKDEGVKGKKGT